MILVASIFIEKFAKEIFNLNESRLKLISKIVLVKIHIIVQISLSLIQTNIFQTIWL